MPGFEIEQAFDSGTDPTTLLARIAEEACKLIDSADGASVLMVEDQQLRTVATSNIATNPPGRIIPLETQFAQQILTHRTPICFEDILNDERISAELRGDGRTRSVIVAPLFDDDQPIGMLTVISRRPAAFDGEDICSVMRICGFTGVSVAASMQTARAAREVIESMRTPMIVPDASGRRETRHGDTQRVTEFLADVIRPGSMAARRARRRVRDALLGDELSCVVQPVIGLIDGHLDGVEALSRFAGLPRRGPDLWFAEAHAVGLGVELETLAVRRALAVLDVMPTVPSFGINVTPAMLLSGELPRLLDGRPNHRVMIELTEQLAIDDYAQARAAVDDLRSLGARVAIDDVGAGYSSFRHVVELEPDCIKLDRSFIAGFETKPMWAQVARAVVQVANNTGATLVAEGIETEPQLITARQLGITLGQGYLIARPGPAPEMPVSFGHLCPTDLQSRSA